ncbi:MAG: M14 family zinc carboxypeptidase, partial [Candidatus Zixiibacteriota bacterium]
MWAVKISDNPMIDEDEPEILFTAGIHCREVITPEVLFYFMAHLLNNYGTDPEISKLVNGREIWFILACNPDGYYYNQITEPDGGGMWRKNRRNNGDGYFGIDLNRNFSYQWGYDDEGSSSSTWSETYRGTGPFSEPETQNLRDFIIERNFIITVFFHSHGNLFLWPWAYDELFTPDEDIFSTIGDTIEGYNGYNPGPPWTSLYPVNGGSDDWIYAEQTLKQKTFAFTPEVGTDSDNFWPPLDRIAPLVEENLQSCLFLTEIAEDIYKFGTPDKPELILPEIVYSGNYQISWSHSDSDNPAVAFELVEMQNYINGITDLAIDFEYWETGGFTISSDRYSSPPSSFYSGQGSNLNRTITILDPITVVSGDSLKFDTWYNIEEGWDYAYVEITFNGVDYNKLPGNITTTDNLYGNNLGNGITGYSGGWVAARFDLSNYAGLTVGLRLSYRTDSYVDEEGIYIDNIYPLNGFAIKTVLSSSIVDTFYNISDNEEAEYSYKVRAIDAENQWSEFSDLKSIVITSGAECGDANHDLLINILDITFLINFLYKNGPAPEYPYSADVNSTGNINILDITYIIGFLYKSGPDPYCPN